MSVRTRRYFFYAVWFLLLLVPLVTFARNFKLDKALSSSVLLLNSFQRLTGMTAYILLFIQITLGAFMDKWVQVIGAKVYKLHTTQGLFAYGLVLIHPTLYFLITYDLTKSVSRVLLLFLPSFKTQQEILLLFGKTAFVLSTISVTAAYLRTKPFFRRNWRAFHNLNYLVFYSVFYHARVGTDLGSQPFDAVYWLAFATVSGTLLYRFVFPLVKIFMPEKIVSENKSSEK